MMVLDQLEKLRENGTDAEGQKQYMACCPTHDDRTPSLSILEKHDGTFLFKCFGGCDSKDVMSALNYKPKRDNDGPSEVVARYEYQNRAGRTLYWKERLKPKSFRQYRWDDKARKKVPIGKKQERVLYKLPDLFDMKDEHLREGKPFIIYFVEGEKDVETLMALGIPATTVSDKKKSGFTKTMIQDFKDLCPDEVRFVADNDEPGREFARNYYESLPCDEESE